MQIKVLLLGAAIATGGVGPASGLEDPPSPKRVPTHLETDKEIQTAIVKGIVANPNVFAASLRVEVADGMVTLRGRVRNREAKAAAGDRPLCPWRAPGGEPAQDRAGAYSLAKLKLS